MKNEDRKKLASLQHGQSLRIKTSSVASVRNELSKMSAYLPHKLRVVSDSQEDGYVTIERPAEPIKWSRGLPDEPGEYLTISSIGLIKWATYSRQTSWSVDLVAQWANVPRPDMGGSDE
jgi:hypothetical protein